MTRAQVENIIAKTSMAMVYFPLALREAGIKDIQTLRKANMLKVMNLVSLKLSGSLLAKKATRKLMVARRPR